MEFKFSVLFGIILAIIVLAVANVVWMFYVAYLDPAVLVTIIIFTLIFTKLYLGKVSATMKDMIVTSIIWVIIVGIFDVIMVLALGLNFMQYYSNYFIYAGYVLIIILAIVGYKLFTRGGGATPEAVSSGAPAEAATPTA